MFNTLHRFYRQKSIDHFVTEPGMYGVILHSRSPKTKSFLTSVKKNVLPSLCKNGAYVMNPKPKSRVELVEDLLAVEKAYERSQIENKQTMLYLEMKTQQNIVPHILRIF